MTKRFKILGGLDAEGGGGHKILHCFDSEYFDPQWVNNEHLLTYH